MGSNGITESSSDHFAVCAPQQLSMRTSHTQSIDRFPNEEQQRLTFSQQNFDFESNGNWILGCSWTQNASSSILFEQRGMEFQSSLGYDAAAEAALTFKLNQRRIDLSKRMKHKCIAILCLRLFAWNHWTCTWIVCCTMVVCPNVFTFTHNLCRSKSLAPNVPICWFAAKRNTKLKLPFMFIGLGSGQIHLLRDPLGFYLCNSLRSFTNWISFCVLCRIICRCKMCIIYWEGFGVVVVVAVPSLPSVSIELCRNR